jgi:hypothetical protein
VVFVLLPVMLVSFALLAGVVAGVVPVSLAVSAQAASLSGRSFQVAADRLDGTGFAQYAVVDRTAGGNHPEVVSTIESADLYHLCQSVVQSVPGFGNLTLRITAGNGSKPVHADRLVVDTHDLGGDAVFQDIQFGIDASRLDGADGLVGFVGQQASAVTLEHLRQEARSVSAATFKLAGLRLTVKPGAKPCF